MSPTLQRSVVRETAAQRLVGELNTLSVEEQRRRIDEARASSSSENVDRQDAERLERAKRIAGRYSAA